MAKMMVLLIKMQLENVLHYTKYSCLLTYNRLGATLLSQAKFARYLHAFAHAFTCPGN